MAILGPILDFFGGKEQNEANLEATKMNIQAQKDREKRLDRPQSTPFSFYESGKSSVAPALKPSLQGAYETSNIEAGETNPLLAQMRNQLYSGYKPSVGSLADAQSMVDRNISRRQADRDYALNKGIEANQRTTSGDINPLGFNRKNAELANIFAQNNQQNREVDALNLFNTSRQSDIANLANMNQALTGGQVGNKVPTFTNTNPAAASNALLAQTPLVKNIPGASNLGLAAASASSGLQDYLAGQRADQANERFLQVLNRGLGNTGGGTTSASPLLNYFQGWEGL